MHDVLATLEQRDARYGSYAGNAKIAQAIKRAMADSPNWPRLTDAQRESLDLIATKCGRLLNGDANHLDSWHDIAGYAALIEKELTTAHPLKWRD